MKRKKIKDITFNINDDPLTYRRKARARLKAIPGKASKSRTFNIFGLKIPF